MAEIRTVATTVLSQTNCQNKKAQLENFGDNFGNLILTLKILNFYRKALCAYNTFAQNVKVIQKPQLNNSNIHSLDKKKILLSILNRTNQGKPNIKAYKESEIAYISTKNLPASLVKAFSAKETQIIKGVKICLVPLDEIQKKVQIDFDYLEFSSFEIRKNKVLISLQWHFIGGGFSSYSYEFKKVNRKWKGLCKYITEETPPEYGLPLGPGIDPPFKIEN